MAKVTKADKNGDYVNPDVRYMDWPSNDLAILTAKSVEWENGEGMDIHLGNTKIELTHVEYDALVAAESVRRINVMLDRE